MGALAAYTSAPSVAHHEALLNVVCYVGSIAGQGLTFEGSDKRVCFGAMRISPPVRTHDAEPRAG
jgi:hypothetical protein